jgi:hypothetical protein
MEWAAIWKDLVGGLLIAGAIGAWVPDAFWQSVFLTGHPTAAAIWAPLVGPLVAVISFVCSIGNVPLAVVLWTGGISFGGVVAFIFADLIILPILTIYRRYYGLKMAAFLAAAFYTTAAFAGYVVDCSSAASGWSRTDQAPTCPTRASPGTTPPGSTSPSSSWPPRWWRGSSARAGHRCWP